MSRRDDLYHFEGQNLLGIKLFCHHVECYLCMTAVCIIQLNGFITTLVEQPSQKIVCN